MGASNTCFSANLNREMRWLDGPDDLDLPLSLLIVVVMSIISKNKEKMYY
jgi:hypothetical protein